MLKNTKQLIFILIFIISSKCALNLNVKFKYNYNAKVESFNKPMMKRDLQQFFDKAAFSFNGFEKVESVPVMFPLDICIMKIEDTKYAAALQIAKGVRNFVVFRMNNGSYTKIVDLPTPLAIAMDCKTFDDKAYVALAFNITKSVEYARDASPIYQISGNRMRAVQYFATPNLVNIYLRATGNELFLLQSFENSNTAPNQNCPYYKWSGTTFNKMGRIPCSNARHLEPFSIDYESYVAVANYANQHGKTKTYSEIYKFSREKRKFELFQKIKTNGAIDVKYFSVPINEVKNQHFLVFGNSIGATQTEGGEKDFEANSVFYVLDKGQFIPYQQLLFYAVEKFLPMQNSDEEKFLLLVASSNQDTKIFNFNDWKFEESDTQYTEGALGKGVSQMRVFIENGDSYLVIANELMAANETNIFKPIFKQEEHANTLRQEIIDWAKNTFERLQSIDVEKLKQDAEEKLKIIGQLKMNVDDIKQANINTVETKTLSYPPLGINKNYLKALSYANQALNTLASQLEPKQQRKREVHTENPEKSEEIVNLDNVYVKTLIVRNKITSKNINGIEVANPIFESITANETYVTGKIKTPNYDDDKLTMNTDKLTNLNDDEFDEINVDELQISGNLNEYSWEDIVNNTLKRTGAQIIKGPATIGTLVTKNVEVINNHVNDHNLRKLVSIKEGNYVINQDIEFAAPISAKNVIINERLNNIHVYKNKFDVLLKKSNETQIVEGLKTFKDIKVLESIIISGKMEGPYFESISPTKTIDEELTLTGNYTIIGDVNISKLLNVTDIIFGNTTKHSTKKIMKNGIRVDNLENVNIKFEQPIIANNSIVSFVNGQDLQDLVKINTDEVQLVTGEKMFNNSLDIRGFTDLKYLNGINVQKLEHELLLKDTNQTIKVPMHFSKVIAQGIIADKITLGDKDLATFLTKSGDQHINGELTAKYLHAKIVKTENLDGNGNIFNESLSRLFQQKAKQLPIADILQNKQKFPGTIYVKNLKLNTSINGMPVSEIERKLAQLYGNIKYVGNYRFNHNMKVRNLSFYGKLNDISAADFGRCWLQKYGDQTFTAPQTFAGVTAMKGVLLSGKLNGYNIDDFIKNTYWINRTEHINDVVFLEPVQIAGALYTQTMNGLRVPDDILFRHSQSPQILREPIVIEKNLLVKGKIYNTTIINDIDIPALERFLDDETYETLHVENATFTYAPYYQTLNGHDIGELLDTVWQLNDDVELKQRVVIEHAVFEGLLDFKGTLNNINLNWLKDNYFSLSKPQEITTKFIFNNDVIFEDVLEADELQVYGLITDTESLQIRGITTGHWCLSEL
ncbi:uncharacterized protein LOC119674329 [Teleopsis dalmanni]|uniref:uncharacterized protein LOC119674329 n=1 Tax=Teleopsis dalmanni TaxID=139649 RepID=UPI0018CEBF87|nr:uncharacterized protein LOC119674329 [Teleopsis dalmanni]